MHVGLIRFGLYALGTAVVVDNEWLTAGAMPVLRLVLRLILRGTWFCWHQIGRRFPRVQRAIVLAHELLVGAVIAGIIGLAYYLIFTA